MNKLAIPLACLLILPTTAHAKDVIESVQADVVRVIDGDTLDVEARVWVDQRIRVKVRVDGIDTPEIRGKCESEKILAQRAKAAAEKFVGSVVTLWNIRWGKFAGRVVATVTTAQGTLAKHLISLGLARPYSGGKRRGVVLASSSNRRQECCS